MESAKLHVINLPRDMREAYIVALSDTHIGEPWFNERIFKRELGWVAKTDNAFVILNGDLMNTAIKGSVSDIYEEVMPPGDQLDYAYELLKPVKNKILCINRGNHEYRIWRETGVDVVKVLAEKLGATYTRDEAFLKIRIGKGENSKPIVYVVYATHGKGKAQTIGAKANRVHKLSDVVLADVYICSHLHGQIGFPDVYLVPDLYNNTIRPMKREYVLSGTFLNRGGYAVQCGYPAPALGSPRIRLSGVKKDVKVTI